ncbi:MAG: hypothetical protein MJ232_08240 [archaeon]|nr:hypothetical protein [archaeon]
MSNIADERRRLHELDARIKKENKSKVKKVRNFFFGCCKNNSEEEL